MYQSSSAVTQSPHHATSHPAADQQWVELPLAGGNVELKLWGKLPPRWLANLAGGLSGHGVSIQKGYANKISPTVWQGTFEVTPESFSGLPRGIDYIDLAQQGENSAAPTAIQLDRFDVQFREDALYVEVQAPDTVGFLTTLLKAFAFCSLYPAEVSVDTVQGKVHDRFWLKALGGARPSAALCEGLKTELKKLLR